MTVVVLNFHWRSPEKYTVPPWIRCLVLRKLAYAMCIDTDYNQRSKKSYACLKLPTQRPRPTHLSNNDPEYCRPGDNSFPLETRFPQGTAHAVSNNVADEHVLPSHSNYLRQSSGIRRQMFATSNITAASFAGTHSNVDAHRERTENHVTGTSRRKPADSPRRPVRGHSKDRLQEEVIRALSLLVARQELDENILQVRKQWRQVAQVLDRCLFWIFCVATVSSTFILLVIVPMIGDFGITDPVENHI